MVSDEVLCAVISHLISKHGYGSPVTKDNAVNRAGLRKDQLGEAKNGFEELRSYQFIANYGNRGIALDNTEFGALADFLFKSCNWSEDDIKLRLKHYEGWAEHNWTAE